MHYFLAGFVFLVYLFETMIALKTTPTETCP